MSKMMNMNTVRTINSARLFAAGGKKEAPEMRPWQTVCMEYDRVGLVPPANMPRFRTAEDAEIWMCLDSRYNHRLRETAFGWQQAV